MNITCPWCKGSGTTSQKYSVLYRATGACEVCTPKPIKKACGTGYINSTTNLPVRKPTEGFQQ